MLTPADVTRERLVDFVAEEAWLLDARRWDDWAALFTSDGRYWVPAEPGQPDGPDRVSLLDDDAMLRTVKLARLRDARAHSQQPPGRSHHLLQASTVLALDAVSNRFELRTPFTYTELRAGRTVSLPAVAWHHLVVEQGRLKIRLKRVDLLHADQPLPAVEFYI
jgi:3-phenylpropionate/cinnamic acid dioxygenase small subunit